METAARAHVFQSGSFVLVTEREGGAPGANTWSNPLLITLSQTPQLHQHFSCVHTNAVSYENSVGDGNEPG